MLKIKILQLKKPKKPHKTTQQNFPMCHYKRCLPKTCTVHMQHEVLHGHRLRTSHFQSTHTQTAHPLTTAAVFAYPHLKQNTSGLYCMDLLNFNASVTGPPPQQKHQKETSEDTKWCKTELSTILLLALLKREKKIEQKSGSRPAEKTLFPNENKTVKIFRSARMLLGYRGHLYATNHPLLAWYVESSIQC